MGVGQLASIPQTVGSQINDTVTKAASQQVGSIYVATMSPKSSLPPTTSAEIHVDHGWIPLCKHFWLQSYNATKQDDMLLFSWQCCLSRRDIVSVCPSQCACMTATLVALYTKQNHPTTLHVWWLQLQQLTHTFHPIPLENTLCKIVSNCPFPGRVLAASVRS